MGTIRDFFSKLNDFAIIGGATLIQTEKIQPVERGESGNGSRIGEKAFTKDTKAFPVPKNKFMKVMRKVLPDKASHTPPIGKTLKH